MKQATEIISSDHLMPKIYDVSSKKVPMTNKIHWYEFITNVYTPDRTIFIPFTLYQTCFSDQLLLCQIKFLNMEKL